MPKTPSVNESDPIEISLEDLEGVVGGATTLTKAQLNQIAGFDTSGLDLSAGALQSGTAEAAVAHAVAIGQGTEANAMHLLEVVAAQNNVNVGQALAGFAEQITHAAGHTNDWGVVGREVASQISGGQLTAASAMQGIEAALTGKTITPDHAVSLLSGLAAAGDASLQATIGGELTALVAHNQISGDRVMVAITDAVSKGVMTGDHAVSVLAGVASGANQTLLTAAGAEIAGLIGQNYVTAGHAMTDIDSAVAANKLGGDQAITLLAGVAAAGTLDLQAAAGREIGSLVSSHKVTAAQAIADLDSAVSGHALGGTAAVGMLAGIAAASPDSFSAASAEIGALVKSGNLTGAQAAAALASATVVSDAGVAAGAAHLVAAQIDAGTILTNDVFTNLHKSASSIDGEVTALAALGGGGSVTLQSAVQSKIASLIMTNSVSTAQAMVDIGAAAIGNRCTGDQAIDLMLHVAATPSSTGTVLGGSAATLAAVGSEIATMVASGAIGASQAMKDLGAAVTAKALNADQAVTLLAAACGSGAADVQLAAANQISSMVTAGALTSAKAMSDIAAAVSAKAITADQAAATLVALATVGDTTMQASAAAQIASMMNAGTLTAAQTAADVRSAITAKVCNADQAIGLLAGVFHAAGTSATQAAVAGQIGTLISSGTIGATQAMVDIGAAITAKTCTADEAVGLLLRVGAAGSPAVQAAVGAEIALLATGTMTVTQALADVGAAVSTKAITADQAVTLLACTAAQGNALVQTKAIGQIAAMVSAGTVTAAQAAADVAAAVTNAAMTADQGVTALALLGAVGNATLQSAAAGQLSTLIESGKISAAQAMVDIGAAVTAKTCTADQAVALVVRLAASGAGTTQAAIGTEIATLISSGAISAGQAMADIGTAIAGKLCTADQAMNLLMRVGTSTSAVTQAAIGAEIATLIASGAITATQAMVDVGAALTAKAVTADQAVTLLACTAAAGPTAVRTAATGQIAAMVAAGTLTAAQAVTDIGTAVTTKAVAPDQAATALAMLCGAGNPGLRSGAAGQLAAMIASGAMTAAQAMTGMDAALAAKTVTADQALAALTTVAATGSVTTLGAVAGEIRAMIASGAITATQAMTDISAAVTAKAVNADQAVTLLACTAAGGTGALQTAAVGQIASMIAAGALTADKAAADIAATVTTKALTADQAVTTLIGLGAVGSAAVQTAVVGQITNLIKTVAVTPAQAMTDVGAAIAAGTCSADQAMNLLVRIATAGPVATQAAVGTEITTLISTGTITAARAMADVGTAIAGNACTADQAVALLTNVYRAGAVANQASVKAAAGAEVNALIASGTLTAAQAMSDIASAGIGQGTAVTVNNAVYFALTVAAGGTSAVQAAVAAQLVRLDTNGATSSIRSCVTSGVMTADQAVTVLCAVAGAGGAAAQNAAASQVTSMVNDGIIAPAQAVADVNGAIAAKFCNADQAMNVLIRFAAASPAATQTAGVGGISALIASGAIAPAQAMADIGVAVAGGVCSADQVMNLLVRVGALGSAAVQAAVGAEIVALVTTAAITPVRAMTDLTQAITAKLITADQAIRVLANVAAATPPAPLQAALGGELATLIGSGAIGAAQAMTDIDAAVSAKALSGDQAVTLLACAMVGGNVTVASAAAGEIAALVTSGAVTAAQAVADIGAAARSKVITGDQAVAALFTLSASPALQAAAVAQVVSLVANGTVTAWGAMTDIGAAIGSGGSGLNADQAMSFLTGLAVAAPAALEASVGAEIRTLIGAGVLSATQAAADITAAVTAKAITGDQAVGLLACTIIGGGAVATQKAAADAIAALVNAGAVTATQAVMDVCAAVAVKAIAGGDLGTILTALAGTNNAALQAAAASGQFVALVASGAMTAHDAFSSLAQMSNSGGASQGAAAAQVVAMITAGLLTPAQAMAEIGAGVANKTWTSLSVFVTLARISSLAPAAVQAAVATEFATLINAGVLPAATAMGAVADAIRVNVVSADQVMTLLARIAATGAPGMQASAGAEVLAMIAAGQISSAQAAADIAGGVSAAALTADHAVKLLAILSTSPDVSAQAAAAGQLVALVNAGAVSPAQAMADIDAAASSGAIPSLAAVNLVARVWGAGTPAIQAAATAELASLIGVAGGTAASLLSHMDAVTAHTLSGDQLVGLFTGAMASGNATARSAIASEIGALVSQGVVTAAQVVADLDAAVTAHALTQDQAVAVVAALAVVGDQTLRSAAVGEVFSLIQNGVSPSAAIRDMAAVVSHAATVALMADVAGSTGATRTLQSAIGAALVSGTTGGPDVTLIAQRLGIEDATAVLTGFAAASTGTTSATAVSAIASQVLAASDQLAIPFFGSCGKVMIAALAPFGLDRALAVVDAFQSIQTDKSLLGPMNHLLAVDAVKVAFGAMTGDAAALEAQQAAAKIGAPFDAALARLAALVPDNKPIQDLQTARAGNGQAAFELYNQVRLGHLTMTDATAILAAEGAASTAPGATAATARLNDMAALYSLTGPNVPAAIAAHAVSVIAYFQAEQAAFPGHAPSAARAAIDFDADRWLFGTNPGDAKIDCQTALSLLAIEGAITGQSGAAIAHAAVDMAQYSFPNASTIEVLLNVADQTGNDHGVLDVMHGLLDGKPLQYTVHKAGATDGTAILSLSDVLYTWASAPNTNSLFAYPVTKDALLADINDSLVRLQVNRDKLADPILPGLFQAEVTLARLDKTISDLIVDKTADLIFSHHNAVAAPNWWDLSASAVAATFQSATPPPVDHSQDGVQAALDALAGLNQQLLDHYGVAVSAGRTMLPLVDMLGNTVAAQAIHVGQLAASTADSADPGAQAAQITALTDAAHKADVPTDAALALAAFGAAGHSTVLNMTMTARLMGGTAQQELMDRIAAGKTTGDDAATILSTAVQALAASNAPDAKTPGGALGFDEATARGLVIAQLACALSSTIDADNATIAAAQTGSIAPKTVQVSAMDGSPDAVAAALLQPVVTNLGNALGALQHHHGSDVITGIGAMMGLMVDQPKLAPADQATATAMQVTLSKLFDSTLGVQTQEDMKQQTLTTGKLSDADSAKTFTEQHVNDFYKAFQSGNLMGQVMQKYAPVKVEGPLPEGQTGDLGKIWTNTTDMPKTFLDKMNVGFIDNNNYVYGASTGAAATALVQASLGAATFTAQAGGSVDTGAGVTKFGAKAWAQVGAFASLSMQAGPVKMMAFVEASAEGRVQVGLTGVSLMGRVGATAGVQISEEQSFDMNGISAVQSTQLQVIAGAAASGTASVGLINQVKFGAYAGAYASASEDLKFGAGPLDATSTVQVMSPGALGASGNAKIGLNGSKLEFDLSATLGLEIAGIGIGFKGSIDASQAIDFVKDDVGRAVAISLATYKDLGESVVSATGTSMVAAGSTLENAASTAVYAVDTAFKNGFSTVADAVEHGLVDFGNAAADTAKGVVEKLNPSSW